MARPFLDQLGVNTEAKGYTPSPLFPNQIDGIEDETDPKARLKKKLKKRLMTGENNNGE
jgi:hypothetical protein